MPADPTYTLVSRVRVNRWNHDLQRAEEGWNVTARWTATGTLLPVFVPLAQYVPDKVDALIRAAGAKDEAIAALGS